VLLKEIRKKNIASNEEISMEQVEFQSVTVPSSWEICGLGEVAEIERGVTFPGSAKSDSPRDGYVACLRTASIQSEIDWEDLIYIPQSHVRRMDQWVAPNDILISMANSYELVGKVAIVRSCPKKASFGAFLAAIRPILVDPYYLLYVLRSPRMQFSFRASSSQTTNIANISLGRMRPLPFPLPPLAEQKRIVAKVDELMGLCDALEAQQQERELRKSVLVRSSLSRFAEAPTPENLGYLFHKSYDIPPSELRKSILTLAVQGLLVAHDSESADWGTRRLKDLTTKIGSGSTPSGGKESYQASGVPLIRSMNVHFGGFVRQGLAFLNDEQAEKLKNVAVKADDVLLNITGASIGRVATAPRNMEGARVNQHVCIVRPTSEITPQFLELFLASPVVQNLIETIQVGGTREALTKAMIEQFEIPVPSIAEQRRIVARVDQLMALVDELERQQAASRENATKLLDAIVQEMTSSG
jgi:type I restriction enzyme S subunit